MRTSGLKTQSITVAMTGRNLTMDALCCDGLAIHRAPAAKDGWKVTHIESGMAVGGFPSKAAASRTLRALLPLTDWTRTGKAVVLTFAVDPALRGEMQHIVKTNGGVL
jgi:hypothetical protein